jgi:putative two-component system response regulator
MDIFPTEKPIIVAMGLSMSSRLWVPALLMDNYEVKLTHDVGQLLRDLNTAEKLPSLILLECQMPLVVQEEIFSQIKSNTDIWRIPVVLFGSPKNDDDELLGFEQGAADFITLPCRPDIFKAKIRARLKQNLNSNIVCLINEQLELAVARRTVEIGTVQDASIMAMTALAKTRDSETGNHICRTQHYVRALSMALQTHPRFRQFLTHRNIEILFKSAPLHDIGKVGIPDRILLKPGTFDTSEMEIMKTHTTLGRDAIQYAERLLEHGLDFLTIAKEIAYSHHEKWDGSGYPQGLVGDAIPISARLMAVADVYDAIISRRVYKPGMPHQKAVNIILKGKGTHFDPDIVDAFLSILDEFQAISAHFPDSDIEMRKKSDAISMAMETLHE